MAEPAQSGGTPDLFVSYASRDRERVLPIIERLEAAGVTVWIDREGISGGANYALEIAEAIEQARAILLMCSEASLASRNVKQEIALGWRFEKPYLPLLLEPVEIPKDVAYWLEAAQWVEVLEQPESVWFPKLSDALVRFGIEPTVAESITVRERPLLVGREREQGVIRTQLDAMVAGRGSLVLIGGEAGIGKTTLVEDLTIDAEEQGCLVLWGHAYDLSITRPYGPWLEMAAAYPSDDGLPPLPGFVGNPTEIAALGSADRLNAEIVAFYLAVARVRPLVLVLDDLHWFDEASLDLLRALARVISTNCILILCTFRSDEIHRHHYLFEFLPLLVREAHAIRVDVPRLDDDARRALIAARYALPLDETNRLAEYLANRSEGNPLYAEELLNALEQDRILTRTDGGWNLGEITDVHVPALLRQVIETRLKHLSPETYALLQIGAVIGQDVPIDLWQKVTDASDESLIAALEQGREARVLDEGPDGTTWGFRHALIREALYEELVSLRRRNLHRQIAAELAGTREPDPDAVSYHFQAANDARAAEWLIRAGERAGRNFAWNTGADRLTAALAWLEPNPAQDDLRGWLLLRLADMLHFSDRRSSLPYLEEARAIGQQLGNRALTASARSHLGATYGATGQVASGIAEFEAVIELEESLTADEWGELYRRSWGLIDSTAPPLDSSDPASRELMIATCAPSSNLLHLLAGLTLRQREVVHLGERFLRRLATAGSDDLLLGHTPPMSGGWIIGLEGLAMANSFLGRFKEADHLFARSDALLRRLGSYPNAMHGANHWLGFVCLTAQADDLSKRAWLAAAGREYAEKATESWSAESVVRDVYAYPLALMVVEGRWNEARQIAERGSARAGAEANGIMFNCDMYLLAIAANQGDGETVWRLTERYAPAGTETDHTDAFATMMATAGFHAAQLCLDQGDLSRARTWLAAVDRWVTIGEWGWFRAASRLLWARYHELSGDHVQARQHAEQAFADAANPRQPLALLAAHRFLGNLDTTDGAVESAEEHLQQSLHLAEACAAPFERALTLLEIARLRSAEDRPSDARTLLAEVRAICEPLAAKPTLERVADLERMLDSTGREPHHV